jgi:hypothetical protein
VGALLDAVARVEPFERAVWVDRTTVDEIVPLLTLGLSPRQARVWLDRDLSALARCFLEIADCRRCRLRLEVLTRNACTRFHHDQNTLRLLCTYAGPGTYWVAREHVNVDALFELGGDIELANRRIVPEPSRVQQAAAWDVLLLKGARFSEPEGVGAVHRSPPAATLGIPRLLATIDTEPAPA